MKNLDLSFREKAGNRVLLDCQVELMLYICKDCEHSFSLPLLSDNGEFLFRVGEDKYLRLSFAENMAFYTQTQQKIKRYAYPYLNFDGFPQEDFLQYVNEQLWGDLIDRLPDESVYGAQKEVHCPRCGSQKLKTLGRLVPCTEEEADFHVWETGLTGFCALSEEQQNKTLLLLMKKYANDYRQQDSKNMAL